MTRHDTASKTGMKGEDLRTFRKQKKLTQTELGSRIGLTDGQIGRLERGESGFSEGFREALIRAFPDFESFSPTQAGPRAFEDTQSATGEAPSIALDYLKGGEYIATRLLGWSRNDYLEAEPFELVQQVEQYLARHPEDSITKAWLENYYTAVEKLHSSWAVKFKALERLGEDHGAGLLSNLLSKMDKLDPQADWEHLLNLGDELTGLRDLFLTARAAIVSTREDVRKRAEEPIPPDLSPRRSLEFEAQRAEYLRSLEALDRKAEFLAERARLAHEAVEQIRRNAVQRANT